jgi:hypothetical protein
MIADKIFYADSQHHVIVTDSTFIVRDKEYFIPSIRDHIIKEVKPVPVLGSLIAITGVLVSLAGMFHVSSFDFIPSVALFGTTVAAYWCVILAGAVLLFSGLILIALVKPRYALHISTAQGAEDDVIVSPKRESIKQIIDALNRAFMFRKK